MWEAPPRADSFRDIISSRSARGDASHIQFLPDMNASKTWLRQSFTGANGMSFTVSVGVIRGAKAGPTFANVAGQHGMEHIGPLVLRDFFEELDPQKLAGTVYLCPCANPLALAYNFEVFPDREQNLPEPGAADLKSDLFGFKQREDLGAYNMNRCWPDDIAGPPKPEEGVATEVTRWLWKTMIAPADLVIDHHSVKRCCKPYIFCDEPAIAWTPFLGLEGVWCTGPLPPPPTPYAWQRLCLQSIRHGKVGICIEYSRQFEVCEEDRAIGRFALLNTMKALGMIEGTPEFPKPIWLIPSPYWEHYADLQASSMGHIHFLVEEYQWLRAGDTIARLHDLQTNALLETITAPCDCLMLHRTGRAVSRAGEWVCRVSKDAKLLAKPGQRYDLPPLRPA